MPDSPVGRRAPSISVSKDDKPSLLARMSDAPPSISTTSPSSPSPISPSLGQTQKSGSQRGNRKRRGSAPSPWSPSASTPLTRASLGPSPLSSEPVGTTSPSPSGTGGATLATVTEAPIVVKASDSLKPELAPPSPMPSPRPFTPMGRDWAAEDEEDEEGDLPSLDDWGFKGVKPASDNRLPAVSISTDTAWLAKLSLSTDSTSILTDPTQSTPKLDGQPSFGGIIPPTPVAPGPAAAGLSIRGASSKTTGEYSEANTPNEKMDNNLGGRAGRAFFRANTPQPLALAKTERSLSPTTGLDLSGTGSKVGPLIATSGGVALGVRSRPTSPAAGVQLPSSPSAFDITIINSSNSRPNSPGFLLSPEHTRSRPTSPAFIPRSPGGRALSGGVSLGVSRPASPNDAAIGAPGSPKANLSSLSPSRPRGFEGSWRSSPRLAPSPLIPEPERPSMIQPVNIDNSSGQPSFRGGRGGRGANRGGYSRGGYHPRGGSGSGAPPSGFRSTSYQPRPMAFPLEGQQQPGDGRRDPSATGFQTRPQTPPSFRNSGPAGMADPSDRGEPTSPMSATSSRGSTRGHSRSNSRPIIAQSGFARINATLSPSKRATKPNDTVPVVGI